MDNNKDLNILKTIKINKKFRHKKVVNDISINIKSNEIIGLLGPNGAGKTTLFYIILGLINPNSGQIFLNNINLTYLPVHQRAKLGLGYLPQENSVFRKLTVEENIYAILELIYTKKKDILNKLDELLYSLKIEHIRYNKASSLSGGERRRVEIARTLAIKPKFILLDEPFAGVDPLSITEVQQTMLFLKQNGIGIVITDHNVLETFRICDYAYIINTGSILAQGKPLELSQDEMVKKVYLGEHFFMR